MAGLFAAIITWLWVWHKKRCSAQCFLTSQAGFETGFEAGFETGRKRKMKKV